MQPIYVNALASFEGGQRLGREAEKRRYVADNAQGIASGNQNALAGMMQHDPNNALAIGQQMRNENALADERKFQRGRQLQADERAVQQFQMQYERHTATMSAAERAEAAQETERALAAISAADTPEEWDRLATEFGAAEYVGKFDQREALFNSFLGLQGALAMQQPAKPADEYGRYVQETTARGEEPLDRIGYAQAKKGQGLVLETSADGVKLSQGGAQGAVKFTEGQSKDNVYATRASGSLDVLNGAEDELLSLPEKMATFVPGGNYLQSEEYQIARAAGEEFLQAILRKDTGAAITAIEQDLYGQVYLPQPGDKPGTLAHKRQARERAIAAIEAGMSPAQMVAKERALLKTDQSEVRNRIGDAEPSPDNPFLGMSEEDFRGVDIMSLTPEQVDQMLEARGQ